MAKRSISAGRQQTFRWRISQIQYRFEPLGDVEAPDADSAIKQAIERIESGNFTGAHTFPVG